MKSLDECDYLAFISYAHADDELWYGWVRCFCKELERGLQAAMRGVTLPRLHLSSENGPVSGVLSEELKKRVAASFALIIVVHENYAHSDWCLKELEYFKSLFGDDGFRQRLYIVALSRPAMLRVQAGADWQRLMPNDDQIWVPFYDPADDTRPLDVYMAPGLVATAFRTPFEKLRNDFEARLRQAIAQAPTSAPTPAPAPGSAPGARLRTIARPDTAAATGPAAAAAAPVLFGLVAETTRDAAAAALVRLQASLLSHGVALRQLAAAAVFSDFADFATADRLVLPFDDSPPMMASLAAGGHLELQRDAWLRRGRPADRVHWLDLRADRSAPAPAGSAAAFVAQLGVAMPDVDALAELLRPPPPTPPKPERDAAMPGHRPVRIYIESNVNERTLWEPLGEQIRRTWDVVSQRLAPDRVPPLVLRSRGLPVDQIDRFPSLDDADGVVLLWGRKTAEALVAQINKVENKMAPGRDAAPGIVAYLMPPQQASGPVPAWGWQVLRFDARDERAIDVLADEMPELQYFLEKVLQRYRQREVRQP